MNYLAHARLSFNNREVLVGNMISDYVKGKKKFDYSPGVQAGIMLHRHIDTFTDEHEVTRRAKEIFRPVYRLYSGAFVDVVYDHFLALDEVEFPGDSLRNFTHSVYNALADFEPVMPMNFAMQFPYMRRHDWLLNYGTRQGIGKSFRGLAQRA